MKKLKLLASLALALVIIIAGCKDDDYEAKVGVCPTVVSTIQADKAIDVPLNQVISATFNEKMDPATINQTSFIIQQGTTAIAGTVAYSDLNATFTPTSPLQPNVLYSGTIKTLAKDLIGQSLMENYNWSFTTIAQVTLASNPTEGGTTTGTGTFAKGSSVTVNATANADYSFINWTLNGTPVSTTPSYQFTMDGNKALVANFSLQFGVGISSNPAEGGITTGSGLYAEGANVTVTATPNTGYTFVNWTEGLTVASTEASYAFQLNETRNLVANFEANTFTLNVTAVNGSVLKDPSKTAYNNGEIVVLTATPETGYTFSGWSGDATGSLNPVSVTMNANKNVTANFTDEIPPLSPMAIDLGCAAPYAILAGSTIVSTGPSIINGDMGLSPGSALVGFPPGTIDGTIHIDAVAAAAKLCLTEAYNEGQGRSLNRISLPGQLGGLTLPPGLYSNSSTSGISGTGANGILTLDAQGDANAVWIFQIGSTFTTDPATSVVLSGGAQAKNIFWIVSSSATLGTNSVLYGNILADQAITLNTGAVLNGRALARIAAVTLDASTITKP